VELPLVQQVAQLSHGRRCCWEPGLQRRRYRVLWDQGLYMYRLLLLLLLLLLV
jgi:hypothetical protein